MGRPQIEIRYRLKNGLLNTPCYECTSHKLDSSGYPQVRRNGTRQHVHRYLFQQVHGLVNDDVDVHHKCESKMCIRVSHLEAKVKGQHSSEHNTGKLAGEKHPNVKLTENQVCKILKDTEHTQQQLADKHRVGQPLISKIKRGERWSYISA